MRLIRLLKHDLAREASDWVEQDIISADQARIICQRYGSDYPPPNRSKLGYRALLLLGYLFLGLAAITLVGANWDEMPRWLRMAGLVTLTAGVQGYATRQWFKGAHESACGLYFLGNLLYGVSIILIAQIYHLGEHMPDGVYWWALGCLPFALLCRSSWLMVQTFVLALIWFNLEVSMGYPALSMPLFLISAVWILVVARQNTLLFIITAFSISYWLETSLAFWWSPSNNPTIHVEHLFVGAGLLLFGSAIAKHLQNRLDDRAKDYGLFLQLWCMRGALVILFFLSFEGAWRALYRDSWHNYLSAVAVVLLLVLAAIALVRQQAKALLPIAVCGVALIATSVQVVYSPIPLSPVALQIASNLLLVVVGIWLIINGIQQNISVYFFTGITVLLITALLRYFDLIGDYVGAAALFTVFALLMLGAARYWNSHQTKSEAV